MLNLQQWILLVVAFAALIPAYPLLRLYFRTRIREYLLFCAVFFLSSLFSISFILAQHLDTLIFWQITFTARNTTYALFFWHTVRMLWRYPPAKFLNTGLILYVVVQFSILFWEHNPLGPGAGLYTLGGREIFSTDYRFIANIFQLYVAVMFFYAFQVVDVENPATNVRYSRLIMLLMSSLLVITRIYRLVQNFGLIPPSEGTEILGSALLVFGFLMIGSVFILDPAAIMLSRVQVGGILVMTDSGVPITSFKFKEADITISSTLLGGIISAIDSVVGEISVDSSGKMLREVDTLEKTIMIHTENDLTFSILTNDHSTSILKSSLAFFARSYVDTMADNIESFKQRGNQIKVDQIYPLLKSAFPYTAGLTFESWE